MIDTETISDQDNDLAHFVDWRTVSESVQNLRSIRPYGDWNAYVDCYPRRRSWVKINNPDGWMFRKRSAHRIRLLAGPYYEAIIKMIEIENEK